MRFNANSGSHVDIDAGHPYDSKNTYIKPPGWRQCRECGRAGVRARRAARKKGMTA